MTISDIKLQIQLNTTNYGPNRNYDMLTPKLILNITGDGYNHV